MLSGSGADLNDNYPTASDRLREGDLCDSESELVVGTSDKYGLIPFAIAIVSLRLIGEA